VEELEKIISALENDINKGEMIPPERIKEIILSIIPDKKQFVDKIYKYWNTRREDFKKSLLRKFWKDQKYTDKHLATTFRRREREKMKTRRNKKNEVEGLQKLKEIRDTTQKYLTNIVSMMKEREITKKNILILQQMEFEGETTNIFRNDKPNVEDKWKEFLKTLGKPLKYLPSYSPSKPPKDDNKENSHSPRGKDANHKSFITDYSSNNINGEKPDPSILPPEKKPKPRPPIGNRKIIQTGPQDVPLKVDPKQPEKDKSQNEFILRHRIRINRGNRVVIDRYIQSQKSSDPFDDDFNKIVNSYKKYNEDYTFNNNKEANFDNMYEDFLKGKYSGLVVLSESEDDNINFNSQVKSFSTSFKQFLKHKRSYNEMSAN